jgi:hypothetical protein
MTEERNYALLLAALESDRPSPVKFTIVDRAVDQAKFILERIDERWPGTA